MSDKKQMREKWVKHQKATLLCLGEYSRNSGKKFERINDHVTHDAPLASVEDDRLSASFGTSSSLSDPS